MSKIINKTIFAGQIANEMILFIMDIVLALGIIYLSSKVLKKLVNQALKRTHGDEKVINTLNKLLISVINVIFLVMVIFTLLEALGVNTASLVATAGIGGVAIGFGAQSLVKDVISGFFILAEGQYYIGDEVVIQNILGTVVEFNLRTTKLKDYNTGAIHTIPNGSVVIVENRSRVDQLANLTIDIPIDYDPEMIINILTERLEKIKDERIVKGPLVRGISAWKERYYSIFISTTVKNGEIYEMQRVLRKIITEELKGQGIEMYRPILNLEGEDK